MWVFNQYTCLGTSVSDTNDCKFNACCLYCRPVNVSLPLWHINAGWWCSLCQGTIRSECILNAANYLLTRYRLIIWIIVIQLTVKRLPSCILWICIKCGYTFFHQIRYCCNLGAIVIRIKHSIRIICQNLRSIIGIIFHCNNTFQCCHLLFCAHFIRNRSNRCHSALFWSTARGRNWYTWAGRRT